MSGWSRPINTGVLVCLLVLPACSSADSSPPDLALKPIACPDWYVDNVARSQCFDFATTLTPEQVLSAAVASGELGIRDSAVLGSVECPTRDAGEGLEVVKACDAELTEGDERAQFVMVPRAREIEAWTISGPESVTYSGMLVIGWV